MASLGIPLCVCVCVCVSSDTCIKDTGLKQMLYICVYEFHLTDVIRGQELDGQCAVCLT